MQPTTSTGESPWLLTHSGRRVSILDPDPKTIVIEDIAYSLAAIPRFTGHTISAWSVAAHSVLVAEICREAGASLATQLLALVHDASEAYLGDVSTPLKRAMLAAGEGRCPYVAIERLMEARIHQALGLAGVPADRSAIKDADLTALATEAKHLMPTVPGLLWGHPETVPREAHPAWTIKRVCRRLHIASDTEARHLFLVLWRALLAETATPRAA